MLERLDKPNNNNHNNKNLDKINPNVKNHQNVEYPIFTDLNLLFITDDGQMKSNRNSYANDNDDLYIEDTLQNFNNNIENHDLQFNEDNFASLQNVS